MTHKFGTTKEPTLSEVGGKGLSLMRMTQAGLPVPPGFILDVAFFEPWMSELRSTQEWQAVQKALADGDDLASATDALKVVCEALELTTEQEDLTRIFTNDSKMAPVVDGGAGIDDVDGNPDAG